MASVEASCRCWHAAMAALRLQRPAANLQFLANAHREIIYCAKHVLEIGAVGSICFPSGPRDDPVEFVHFDYKISLAVVECPV